MPLVSILIPCYNAQPWLAKAIGSALAQECDKEIVVVDDGSTDDSLGIAESFASPVMRVLSQPNSGASAARNAAFRASRGDWIQFLDADDQLASDKITLQLREAGPPGDEVWSARWARFEHEPDDARPTVTQLGIDADPIDWLITKMSQHDMMHPAAWLIPRSVASRAGPWDERLSLDDDGEYFARVVLAASRVRHCARAISFYRSNISTSLSRQKSEAAFQSALLSARLAAAHLLAREQSPRTRRACADTFMRLGQGIYPRFPSIARACLEEAERHGGSKAIPSGGATFKVMTRIFGWKAASRVRYLRERLKA